MAEWNQPYGADRKSSNPGVDQGYPSPSGAGASRSELNLPIIFTILTPLRFKHRLSTQGHHHHLQWCQRRPNTPISIDKVLPCKRHQRFRVYLLAADHPACHRLAARALIVLFSRLSSRCLELRCSTHLPRNRLCVPCSLELVSRLTFITGTSLSESASLEWW